MEAGDGGTAVGIRFSGCGTAAGLVGENESRGIWAEVYAASAMGLLSGAPQAGAGETLSLINRAHSSRSFPLNLPASREKVRTSFCCLPSFMFSHFSGSILYCLGYYLR